MDIFEKCPVCGSTETVRLKPEWVKLVNGGAAIPVIGCGNPWHYIDRTAKKMQPFDLGRGRA